MCLLWPRTNRPTNCVVGGFASTGTSRGTQREGVMRERERERERQRDGDFVEETTECGSN